MTIEPIDNHNTVTLSEDTKASITSGGLLSIAGVDMQGMTHLIHLEADEAWGLLQWLADYHRDRLYKLSQHPEQRGGVKPLMLQDTGQIEYQEFSDELAMNTTDDERTSRQLEALEKPWLPIQPGEEW